MKKVCFLFNHYFIHQIPHAAPYAFELSRNYPQFQCIIACSSPQELAYAKEIGGLYPGHECTFKLLEIPRLYRLLDPIVSKWAFYRKRLVLKKNLDFFKEMDALVAPERNCMQLKTRFGLDRLTMIHCRHGAGDRAGGFDKRLGMFDFILLPGKKIEDRLNSLGWLRKGHYAVVGYPKFEVILKLNQGKAPPRFFSNDNPVAVYNPHFDQRVASWNQMGLDVLELFKQRRDSFNLIFAPHVVLFRRRFRHRAKNVPREYYNLPNFLIDLGSERSADMTYTLNSNIYIGDVSSQVYEFILKPRPCIFLNSHGIKWENDPAYFHWTLGQVVTSAKELDMALDKAFDLQRHFEPLQKKAFEYTFYTEPGSTAAQRGARAIAEFLS
ncbi:MAG: hypothetical protein GXO58_02815 [Thermodesulfobacteria bacterium]|nr:hypothetical protein [Thermodesulfobacteriota bacterium]